MKSGVSWKRVATYLAVILLILALLLFRTFRSGLSHPIKSHGGQKWGRASGVESESARPLRESTDPQWCEAYGKLALRFEANRGQSDPRVRFLSHGSGYELFLTEREAVLALGRPAPSSHSSLTRFERSRGLPPLRPGAAASVLRLRLVGASPAPRVLGLEELSGKSNYFIGNDPRNWRTGVASYGRVKYQGIYPGVDLVFYGNHHRLEYDFVVAPGADPTSIALDVEGARSLRVNGLGDLLIHVPGGEVQFQRPVVYQDLKGARRRIAGQYALLGNHRVSFKVAAHDRSEPLIIDPVLNYSTFLGGSGPDTGLGIAVDSLGHAFVTGQTFSTDFPTTLNGFNPGPLSSNPKGAVFVTEMNPTGTAEVYSTYLSGDGGEFGAAIALDSSNPPNVYVTGVTFSTIFPTTAANALNSGPLASNSAGTAFLSKINSNADGVASLVYSTYLGGTGGDSGVGVAADAGQNAYVTGLTASSDFPTTPTPFQSAPKSTAGNAFITRIDTTKSGKASLIYSTYLGGTGSTTTPAGDAGSGIAVDSAQNAYVVGTTFSTDFPTTPNAFHPGPLVSNPNGLAFVSRINTTLSGMASLIYSTYLGGTMPTAPPAGDAGSGIAVDSAQNAYVVGTTFSTDFPTIPGAFQKNFGGAGDAFVSKIATSLSGGASLAYSTFLGGIGKDQASGIAVDSARNAYVAGSTASADFPIAPKPGAFRTMLNGPLDAFVAKLPLVATVAASPASLNFGTQLIGFATAPMVVTLTNNTTATLSISSISITGLHAADFIVPPGSNTCGTSLPPGFCTLSVTFKPSVSSLETATLNFNESEPPSQQQVSLAGTGTSFAPVASISRTQLTFGGQLLTTTSSAQSFGLTNRGNAPLAISQMSVTGDFAQTNTCGSPPMLAPLANCTISVTFSPTAPGARTGSLVLTDNANGSPHTIALNGTGWDYTLTAPPALAITDGSSGTFTLTVTPAGGFSKAVTLTCSGAPAQETCKISPTAVTPDGVNPITATVTVATKTGSQGAPAPRGFPPRGRLRIVLLLLAMTVVSGRFLARRLSARLVLVSGVLWLLVAAGCGGRVPSTPKGTSTLTVTGTSGNVARSVKVTVTVN